MKYVIKGFPKDSNAAITIGKFETTSELDSDGILSMLKCFQNSDVFHYTVPNYGFSFQPKEFSQITIRPI